MNARDCDQLELAIAQCTSTDLNVPDIDVARTLLVELARSKNDILLQKDELVMELQQEILKLRQQQVDISILPQKENAQQEPLSANAYVTCQFVKKSL